MNNYKLDFNVDLKKLCTYGVGGTAKYLYHPKDNSELIDIVKMLTERNIKWYVIGSGSNLIFPDEDFDGAIIKLDLMDTIKFSGDSVFVSAGVTLGTLINAMLDKGFVNLAPLMGIPGTLGGAIVGNAGSYGTDIFSNLEEVMFINNNFELISIPSDNIKHGYRYSEFKNYNFIIVGAKIKCIRGNVRDAKKMIQENINKRVSTQPLEFKNAGSVFKNPEGLSAGALIEECGMKGFKINDAMVSEKHANFIVNLKSATSHDILEVIDCVRNYVKEKKGIDLELEQIVVKW